MNAMRMFVDAWMKPFTYHEPKIEPKGDENMVELVELMDQAIEEFNETGTIEKRLRHDIEFKLWVLNREKA